MKDSDLKNFDVIIEQELLQFAKLTAEKNAIVFIDWDRYEMKAVTPLNKQGDREVLFSANIKNKPSVEYRQIVKIEQLPLQKTEQRQFVDIDEYLTAIRWTDWVSHLMDVWSITARYCGDGMVELVGDSDQIYMYLKENTPE